MSDQAAIRKTWFGRVLRRARTLLLLIAAYIAAAGAVIRWFSADFLAFHQQKPAIFWAVVTVPLVFIFMFDSLPQLVQVWRRRQRLMVSLESLPAAAVDPYFRLDPYVTHDLSTFNREDQAHRKVFDWISGNADQLILYLSGDSGTGKTSVLEGYVLPKLRAVGWRVVEVRSFDDPLQVLENALSSRRRRGSHLLIVLDQFEEFILSEGQAGMDKQQRFLSRVRELIANPPLGLCLSFTFRTEYQSAVESLDLAELRSRSTWTEVAPFGRGAARRFLEGGPQRPSTALVNRLLDGADALDDAPGLYRPITLNILGLALMRFDTVFIGRPERLVHMYLESAIADKPIREVAPIVLSRMITRATTKQPRDIPSLCGGTGLRASDVAACLNRLAAKGLVRRLGQSGLWELSHDFIARQFALLLSRIHPSPWSRVAAFVVPVAFGISLAGAVVAVPIYLQMTSTRAEAAELIPKLHRLQATYDRLNAELANRVYDPVEPDEDQLMQRSIFRIRQTEYSGRLKASDRKAEKYERDIASLVTEAKSLQEQIGLTKQELEMYKTLVAKDLASKLPLMRVSEHLADITIRIETNLREQQKVTEQIAAESGERDAFIMEWHRKLTEEIANVRSERDGVAARIASLQDPFLVLTAPQQSTFR